MSNRGNIRKRRWLGDPGSPPSFSVLTRNRLNQPASGNGALSEKHVALVRPLSKPRLGRLLNMWPLPVTKNWRIFLHCSSPSEIPPTLAGHSVFSVSCSLPTQIPLPSPIPSRAQLSFPCKGGVGDSDFSRKQISNLSACLSAQTAPRGPFTAHNPRSRPLCIAAHSGPLHSSHDFSSHPIFPARISQTRSLVTLLILSIPTPRFPHTGCDRTPPCLFQGLNTSGLHPGTGGGASALPTP